MTAPNLRFGVGPGPDQLLPNEGSASGTASGGDSPHDGGEAQIRESLRELITAIENDPAPKNEHDLYGAFHGLGQTVGGSPPSVPLELIAEEIAFLLHAHDHQESSTWDLYFGPLMSGLTASGEPWDSPPLSSMTPEMLAYWRRRADETPHPVMRARYADLLWELPKKLNHVERDASMARAAVDAYLDAVEAGRYPQRITSIAKAKRALHIALSLRDGARTEHARDALLALDDGTADDESLGLWGFCFDTFVEPPNKRVALTDPQRDRLVADLEARLVRFAARPPDEYHPTGAEAAALRLANHYRRLERKNDVARVLRAYGEIVRRMRGASSPLVVAHSLEQLYDYFKAFGLHADADELNDLLRAAAEDGLKGMTQFSVEKEIPAEKVEAYFAAMLAGATQDVILRIALHFLPRRDHLEKELHELARQAPISYLMTHTIKDYEGRTVAHVGPLESDLEGHLLRHISQHLELSVPWLRELSPRILKYSDVR